MFDTVTRIGASVLQHGPHSDRIYALKLSPRDLPEILDEMDELAKEKGYGKIIAKAPADHLDAFDSRGYRPEAIIPGFFGPGEDLLFLGRFLDAERTQEGELQLVQEVLEAAGRKRLSESGDSAAMAPPQGIELREATAQDVEGLANFYAGVFESYPFPIQDPEHLRKEQKSGTRFFTAWKGTELVAASSMEDGGVPATVEMTDFATLPSHRGKGLATCLLALMDSAAEEAGERVAFTIARAYSFGMNITFARRGYTFGGTLVNNTQISGSIESMNVWYKLIRPIPDLDA